MKKTNKLVKSFFLKSFQQRNEKCKNILLNNQPRLKNEAVKARRKTRNFLTKTKSKKRKRKM